MNDQTNLFRLCPFLLVTIATLAHPSIKIPPRGLFEKIRHREVSFYSKRSKMRVAPSSEARKRTYKNRSGSCTTCSANSADRRVPLGALARRCAERIAQAIHRHARLLRSVVQAPSLYRLIRVSGISWPVSRLLESLEGRSPVPSRSVKVLTCSDGCFFVLLLNRQLRPFQRYNTIRGDAFHKKDVAPHRRVFADHRIPS